ncbi:MAG: hypothetical protein KH195_11730 [Clostridiaceae bacterium]|nr:hypothetical protein [Clostridiaceae bacterium]
MKEYIERATVLNLLEKINPVDFGSMFDYEAHGAVQECLREISYGVEDISAADVAEVRHGKFNFLQEDMVWCYCGVCSVCRNYVQAWNYCPNCGARMDKEDENA